MSEVIIGTNKLKYSYSFGFVIFHSPEEIIFFFVPLFAKNWVCVVDHEPEFLGSLDAVLRCPRTRPQILSISIMADAFHASLKLQ